MCAPRGVFYTTEPSTSVSASSGVSDVGLTTGALTHAEVTGGHLRVPIGRGRGQMSQVDRSHSREEEKDRGRGVPASKVARKWTTLEVYLR